MDTELFKLIVQKHNEWRRQYNEDKNNKKIIQRICNRRYKSKGNKEMRDIHNSLVELGFLEEVILHQTHSGELCYESIYGK